MRLPLFGARRREVERRHADEVRRCHRERDEARAGLHRVLNARLCGDCRINACAAAGYGPDPISRAKGADDD